MERVKALVEKFNLQIEQNADSAVLRQIAIQILAELEANPSVNNLPNNVSVIMPSVGYAQKESINIPKKESIDIPTSDAPKLIEKTVLLEKPVLEEKPKDVFTKHTEPILATKEETSAIQKEVADKIALEPIKDLRTAIGINDKFQFLDALFNNEEKVFETSIKTINSFKNFAEAQFWIKQNLRNKYHWEEESRMVIAFDQLVKRRFS